MKKVVGFLLLVCFSALLRAQELYMPRNIKAAYNKGTRSVTGIPGAAYWQNQGCMILT
ncbi:hypothetical protein KRR40_22610 [Niabella defluvii]|nr:hypothetical protein KRR40_22610 [Niabella sp. I65]